jgi:flagellin-like hook-associated protein FlgL
MSSSITLSAGVRQNLLSLQDTASLLATTQNRLATGKKVNSALDNPTNFFTSQGLSNRASDLNSLLDTIGQAQQTLQAANTGLTSLTSLVQSAKSIATQAQEASKGGVNYTNITGSVAIALDTTSSASVPATGSVATAGVASTQATSTINAAGIAQLADHDTLIYTLGSGAAITATFTTGATATGSNTFADAAGLASVLNTGTGTSGNFGTTATAVAAAGGVTVTSSDVTSNFVIGGTHAGLTTNFSQAASSLGDALTISDGSHSNTFYRVAAGASAANGTYSSAATLVSAIASSSNSIHSTITGTANGTTGITLTAANNVGVTVGGAIGAAIGFGTTEVKNNVNSTLAGLTGTLNVQVGSDSANVLTFGSGAGQISTLSGLNTALAAFTDITGSTDSTHHINFNPTSSDNVTLSGTGSVVSALGLGSSVGTTTPTATVVTPNAVRTNLQSQYNALLTQIDQLSHDSSYNGVNLLAGDNLKVTFNETGSSSLTISGVKFDSTGLGLSTISGSGFQDNHNVDTTLSNLDTALTTLRAQASTFGSTLSTVQTRNDFTKNLVNVLQTGSDNLVLADTNEEGANLLALQTRQSLSTTALSLANQSNQAVLKLLG